MDIRNCTRCGKIYNYDGKKICPTCRREDEEDFLKVRDFLYQYPGANIQEVHEGTQVSTNKIIEFLKQGRLEIADDSNLILHCEKCGASIKTGRFCERCATDLQKELSLASRNTVNVPIKREKEKFRVIDRYKKTE